VKTILLNAFEALNTKQSFFPASIFWVRFIHHLDEWAGKSSLLETVRSLPKTIIHFHVATARTARSPLVLTTLKGKALKRSVENFYMYNRSYEVSSSSVSPSRRKLSNCL